MPWGAPRFIAKSQVIGTANTSGFTINTPNPCMAGDLLFMSLVTNKDTVTPDSAFTQIRADLDSANPWQMILYYKIASTADANGGGSYTWALAGTTAAPNTAVMMAIRDADIARTVTAKGFLAGATAAVVTPAVVPTARASLIMRGCGTRRASATQVTYTGTGNERHDGGNNGASTSYTQAWYDAGTVTDSLSSQAGITITASSGTSLTDRLSYSISFGANYTDSLQTGDFNRAVHRASHW